MSGTQGGLPRFQGEQRVRQLQVIAAPAPTGLLAAAQNLDRLGRVFGQEAEEAQVATREREAQTMSLRDEQGNLVDPGPLDVTRRPDRAFMRVFEGRILDEQGVRARDRAVELRQQSGGDPERFRAAMDGDISARVAELPAALRPRAEAVWRQVGTQHFQSMALQQVERGERMSERAFAAHLGVLRDEAEALSLNGQAGTPEFQQRMTAIEETIQRGIASGYLNADLAEITRRQVNASTAANGFAGQAERIARTQGPEAAVRWVEDNLTRPEVAAAGSGDLNAARARANVRISLVRAEAEQERGAINAQVDNVFRSVTQGAQVPAATLESWARRADAARLPQDAARLRALGTVQGEATAWTNTPYPELQRLLVEASAAPPEDGATAVRLDLLRRVATQRLATLERDPAGFAATQPGVRAAQRAVAEGRGTMAEVVAAADAVQAENGVPDFARRVLPQAEAQRIRAIADRGDNVATARALTEVFQAYGPDQRWRVWHDLTRGGGLPENLRPVMLFIATGQNGPLNTFLNAAAQGKEALQRMAGAQAQGVTDRLASNSALTEFRRTQSGFGFDASLMRDVQEAVGTLAMHYAGTGVDASTAVERAVSQVVQPMGSVISEDRIALRVPAGVNVAPGDVRMALLRASTPASLSRIAFDLSDSGISPALPEDQRQAQFRASLAQFGQWRTGQDGRSAHLMDNRGRPVFTADGRPVTIGFDEATPANMAAVNFRVMQPPTRALPSATPAMRALVDEIAAARGEAIDTLSGADLTRRLNELSADFRRRAPAAARSDGTR
jgi:hypothetical protein